MAGRPRKTVSVEGSPEPVKEAEQTAPVAVAGPAKPRLDVAVEQTEIPAKRWPDIRGGICEFCGIMDSTQPAWDQFKLCPHYKSMDVRCIYCPVGTDMDDVVKGRTIKVRERLDKPGVLTMWCTDFKCEQAHWTRFAAGRRTI